MSEFYEATFRWPHPDASNVIITGSFDGWSGSHHLVKSPSGFFEGTVQIPWGEKVAYKYIVDGRWTTTDDRPTEMDTIGNLNNVFRAPARPTSEPVKTVLEPVLEPETETETETETERSETTATSQTSETGAVGAVGGVVASAKQDDLEHTPIPTPAPASVPSGSENAIATDVPATPQVLVPILSPSAEPAADSNGAPVVDVSESKPLDTAIVEGATTTASVSETPAPKAPEETPSTHVPASAVNGVAPAEDKTVTAGTPTAPVSESPKPAETPASTPGTNGTTEKYATVNGKSPSKKMRFPSLSSRHSRGRSSGESGRSATEHGEKVADTTNGSVNGRGTGSSRFTASQREKRRTSIFGKLKDAFSHHPKNEASA